MFLKFFTHLFEFLSTMWLAVFFCALRQDGKHFCRITSLKLKRMHGVNRIICEKWLTGAAASGKKLRSVLCISKGV